MTKQGRSFYDILERVLERDDKVRFVKLLRNHPTEITKTKSLLEKIAFLGSKKCLLAPVDGKVCNPPPALDVESDKALAYVTHLCPEPRVIDFMLKQCNAIPCVNVSCTIGLIDGLPIHFALMHLSYLEHLYFWSRGDSLITLTYLLCQWKTKPVLDCVRLLAQYTDSINGIAWTLIKYGALKQLGALLLVAREKVVAPFDTGSTIIDYVTSEIISLFECESGSEEEAEYKNTLIDALTLLNIFEKAGDSLSLYCSSMQKSVSMEDVIKDVCTLLRNAKVPVCLYDFYYCCHLERCGLSSTTVYKLADPLKDPCLYVAPAGKLTPLYTTSIYPTIKPIWEPKRFPAGYRTCHTMSTTAGPVRMICKPLEHVHVNPILKHLAHSTVMLKKGLRFF